MGKGHRNRRKPAAGDSDDDFETASMVSASTRTTNMSKRSGASSAFSNLAAEFENFDIDDVDSQITVGITLLDSSNSKKQVQGMDLIMKCIRVEYPLYFVRDNWQTISTGCFRILRSGKDTLCEKACYILGILCFYVEPYSDDGELLLTELFDRLTPFIREEQAHHKKIGKYDAWSPIACLLLGIATAIHNQNDTADTINLLWAIACSAAARSSSTKAAAAINAVYLIVSRLSTRQCRKMLQQKDFLAQCYTFLQDESSEVVAQCGTLIAVLLSQARKCIDDVCETDIVTLAEVIEDDLESEDPISDRIERILVESASQNDKSRSQAENKLLKKQVRRINTTIEEDEYDPMPAINIGLRRAEMLKIDSWQEENFYNCITFFFKGGAQHHLRLNECMREEFGMGEPRVTAFGQSLSSDEDEYDDSGRPMTKKELKDRVLKQHQANKRDKGNSRAKGRANKVSAYHNDDF